MTDLKDKDEGTPTRSWTRWHGRRCIASVFQYGPEQFSAHGPQEEALPKRAIHTLAEAQDYADGEVQRYWGHDCVAERCSDWMENSGSQRKK